MLHMSSLRPVKRIDLLLRIIAMSKNRERIRLFVLAGGPFDPYEPLIDELGLRDVVIVRQNTAVVDEYLEAADAGLYTSEYESFGLSILETMFYGKPVVAFRAGGIPEVLGESYPLTPFGDVTAAAAALDALVESPTAARELGERNRTRALEKFSADRIVPRYETLYRRVIAGSDDLSWQGRQCLFVTPRRSPFAIGTLKSKIANVAVPVVQRIEQGFPKP